MADLAGCLTVREEPTRLLLLGDVHGNDAWFDFACVNAVRRGCQAILQLGDFGYWEHRQGGVNFLDIASANLTEHDLICVWIDGNHENHEVLRLNYGPGGGRHAPTPEGWWMIRPRLFYAPRGSRWTWSGTQFLACGGAYSVDKQWRRLGTEWWPEETITVDEADECCDGGLCDVLVAHDAPAEAEGVIPPDGTWDRKKDAYPESLANRVLLQRIVDTTHPKLVVHGHYHTRNSTVLDSGVRVEGLHCDGEPSSMATLDLPSLVLDGDRALSDRVASDRLAALSPSTIGPEAT